MRKLKVRMSTGYVRTMNDVLDSIFHRSDDLEMNMSNMSKKSGVSYKSVRNINNRKTRCPWFRTVYLLARAVGMEINLTYPKQSGGNQLIKLVNKAG